MYENVKTNLTLRQDRKTEEGDNYRPVQKLFSYKTLHNVQVEGGQKARTLSLSKTISDVKKDIENSQNKSEEDPGKTKESLKEELREMKEKYGARTGETTLVLAPVSKAEAGKNGVAVSSPIAHAVIHPGQNAHIVFEPQSSASAGPGGLAHAHTDLFVRYLKNKREKERET